MIDFLFVRIWNSLFVEICRFFSIDETSISYLFFYVSTMFNKIWNSWRWFWFLFALFMIVILNIILKTLLLFTFRALIIELSFSRFFFVFVVFVFFTFAFAIRVSFDTFSVILIVFLFVTLKWLSIEKMFSLIIEIKAMILCLRNKEIDVIWKKNEINSIIKLLNHLIFEILKGLLILFFHLCHWIQLSIRIYVFHYWSNNKLRFLFFDQI